MQVRIISQQGRANTWNEYGGYKKVFAGDAKYPVIELGCWAHARRKFFDLQVSGAHPQAAEGMRSIGQLCAIEETTANPTISTNYLDLTGGAYPSGQLTC